MNFVKKISVLLLALVVSSCATVMRSARETQCVVPSPASTDLMTYKPQSEAILKDGLQILPLPSKEMPK